jgi:hypothetical protein
MEIDHCYFEQSAAGSVLLRHRGTVLSGPVAAVSISARVCRHCHGEIDFRKTIYTEDLGWRPCALLQTRSVCVHGVVEGGVMLYGRKEPWKQSKSRLSEIRSDQDQLEALSNHKPGGFATSPHQHIESHHIIHQVGLRSLRDCRSTAGYRRCNKHKHEFPRGLRLGSRISQPAVPPCV